MKKISTLNSHWLWIFTSFALLAGCGHQNEVSKSEKSAQNNIDLLGVQSAESCSVEVDPFRELAIVSPFVVEDQRALPGGPWHFSTLIRNMLPQTSTPKDFSTFMKSWLREWATINTINGYPVGERGGIESTIICPWANASNGKGDCSGDLDPNLAPFRLLTIVNRMDLRDKQNPLSAGEGRFVFGLLDMPTNDPTREGSALNLTLIMEYGLPVTSNRSVKDWAEAWHTLGSAKNTCTSNDGCEPYRIALEAVTNRFSGHGVAPSKPEGNALNQIRTNEIALGAGWELREFHLVKKDSSVAMQSVSTAQTPDLSFNATEDLATYCKEHESDILAGTYKLPQKWLTGAAPEGVGQWQIPGVSEEVRFQFSKNTCNGCHADESDRIPSIRGFFHVSPHESAGKSRLSTFVKRDELPLRSMFLKEILAPEQCKTAGRANREFGTTRVH